MMGVRRTTVTMEAQSLAQTGMIQYRRGHITIVNRDALKDCACECYAVIREETNRLMGAG
jgi:hypothetical protein